MTIIKKGKFRYIQLISFRCFLSLITFIIIGVSSIFPSVTEGVKLSEKKTSSLQNYLTYSAKNNPGLKASFNRWKAELERVAQVRSLPDPKINFAYFIKEVETRVGPQQFKLGLMQKIPWFGKLKLKGEKILEKAHALKENFERLKLELFYKIKKLYYDYYYISRSILIIKENIALLKALNEQINSMYSTGSASYSNVIRMQIELDKLRIRMISLEDKLPSQRVLLNSAMNRSIEMEIRMENNIKFIKVHLDRSSLTQILRTNSRELKTLDHITHSESAGVKLAKKNYFPDITFGMDIIGTGDSLMPDVRDNGKNPFIVKMSLNIPIRFKKIKASIRESKLRLESSKYARKEKEIRLIASLESALFAFKDSGRTYKLYHDLLIPKAEQALEVTKTAFSTGKLRFIDFIDTQRTLLEFELMLEKAKSSNYQNLALIEKIIGKNLNNLKKNGE